MMTFAPALTENEQIDVPIERRTVPAMVFPVHSQEASFRAA